MSPLRHIVRIAAVLAIFAPFPAALAAGAETAGASPAMSKTQVERIVHDYLLAHPEILQEMAEALRTKQAQAADAQRAAVFAKNRKAIFDSPLQVTLGNPHGDVTLVEFFDYNCPYCRQSLAETDALLKSDPKLRLVLKEFPILSPASKEAAEVAVAVNRIAPEKYLAFHRALLSGTTEAGGATAMKAAQDLGISAAALSKELATPDISKPIEQAFNLARDLGIDGTPTYVIGHSVMAGAIGLNALKAAIANMRACGKAACS